MISLLLRSMLIGTLIGFYGIGSVSAEDPKTGKFAGTITFKGAAPVLPPLAANNPKAAVCGKPIPDETLVINAQNNGIANVFIFMKSAPKGAAKPAQPPPKIVFDQKNCRFEPHGFFLQTGQQIQVINSDGFAHNVHTYPIRNNAINQVMQGNNQVGFTTQFPDAEILPHKIGCDIHPWMEAWTLILDHPFAAVTNEKGEFEIDGLPPGEYDFRIWQEKAGYLEKKFTVTIEAGETAPGNLAYGPADFE